MRECFATMTVVTTICLQNTLFFIIVVYFFDYLVGFLRCAMHDISFIILFVVAFVFSFLYLYLLLGLGFLFRIITQPSLQSFRVLPIVEVLTAPMRLHAKTIWVPNVHYCRRTLWNRIGTMHTSRFRLWIIFEAVCNSLSRNIFQNGMQWVS